MIVTSFLPAVVAQAKNAFPEVKTGLLVGDGGPLTDLPARLRELYPVDLAKRVRADYLAPHYRLAALGVLRRAAAAGLPCLLWTVNSPAPDPQVRGRPAGRRHHHRRGGAGGLDRGRRRRQRTALAPPAPGRGRSAGRRFQRGLE